MLLDESLCFAKMTCFEAIVHRELNRRLKPEFCLATGVLHMDVQP